MVGTLVMGLGIVIVGYLVVGWWTWRRLPRAVQRSMEIDVR